MTRERAGVYQLSLQSLISCSCRDASKVTAEYPDFTELAGSDSDNDHVICMHELIDLGRTPSVHRRQCSTDELGGVCAETDDASSSLHPDDLMFGPI